MQGFRELIQQLVQAELRQYADTITELTEEIEELHRRLRNQIRIGTCISAGETTVVVQHGGNKTPAIRWFALCAGEVSEYRRPSVGEQCLLLNYGAGEDSSQSLALFGLASDQFPLPTTSATEHLRAYPDGTLIGYDHAAHKLRVQMIGGSAEYIVPEKVRFVTALLETTGDFKAGGEITDHTRSMQSDRDIYNGHGHDPNGPTAKQ